MQGLKMQKLLLNSTITTATPAATATANNSQSVNRRANAIAYTQRCIEF